MAKKPNIEKRNPAVGLRKRYEWSFRTLSRGYEKKGADYCYDSLLSGGPLGALDKIVRRVRARDLPLGPAFDDPCSWELLEEKSGEGYGASELKRELTPELFSYSAREVGCSLQLRLAIVP